MPKGNSGIKRGGGSTGTTAPALEQTSAVRTMEVNETTILNAGSPNAIQQLRDMASRGEIPAFIDGTGADKERIYEEINRLYPDPPGILNDYHLDTSLGPNQVGIFFNYNMAEAESPQFVTYSRRRNTSEAAKAGQIKQEIYRMRPNVEYALSSRLGGFSSYDLAEKYGGRVVSKAERDEANRAIISRVEKLLSSPMTKRGQKMNETDWVERDGGYFRIGTERFATQRGEN